MPRTNVYIDGFNLYYGSLKGTPYRWLDVGKLCQLMLPTDTVQSIKYFTARVSARPDDPQKPVRQQMYFRALKTIPNLSIIYGHFLTHPTPMPLTGIVPIKKVWVDKTEEKGSDVNLATYLLFDAFEGDYEAALIISNDSDLVEPISLVRDKLGRPVGIVNPSSPRGSTCVTGLFSTYRRRLVSWPARPEGSLERN